MHELHMRFWTLSLTCTSAEQDIGKAEHMNYTLDWTLSLTSAEQNIGKAET